MLFCKIALLSTLAAPCAAAQSASLPRVLYSRGAIDQQALALEVLTYHNMARQEVGVPALAWDPGLAAGASIYATELATLNLLRHSPEQMRSGQGENLWMGTRGHFRPARMVGAWASERSMFRAARFPNVSRTDNWADVGHYTQMIWPDTKKVGCALTKGVESDVLVCRYWPAGNIVGQLVP